MIRCPLPWASLHWRVQCTLECHWVTHCILTYHWVTPQVLEQHWKNLVETAPHYNTTRETDYCSLHWNTIRDSNSPHTHPGKYNLAELASMPGWTDKMAAHQAANGQVSVNSAFTWSLLLGNGYQFCSSHTWVLQHHSVHALDMSTIIVFCVFWVAVQMKTA